MVASGSAWASRTPTQAIAHLGLDADLPTFSIPASTTISAFGATLTDDADASAARTTLGLGTLAIQSGTFSGTSSGTNTGDQTLAGLGGANTALGNLASVAINAALVLATSDAFALGSITKMWADLFLADGAVVNFNNGNATITHSANKLTIDGAAMVFNEAGADLDFRIEGDSDPNLFFIDASTGRIGFGTSTPAELIHFYQASGYTTMRFEAASTIGLMYADGEFGFVVSGSSSNHDVLYIRQGVQRLSLASAENVLNDPGNDVDFRVEGDTDANLIFGDAGTDRVGIGTSSPSYTLDVNGSSGKLRSLIYILGSGPDLSLIPVANGQSVLSSYWALQLVGNKQGNVDYSPSNVGERYDMSIVIPNQQSDKIGLVVVGASSQSAALFQGWNSSNATLFSFNKDGGLILNEQGVDTDTRFEGDTDANLFFLDASTDRIGIGVSSPGSKMDIAGSFQCDSITNDTGLASGVYTPTRSAEANMDSNVTMLECQYMRVGNTVTVSGRFTADPTLTATTTSFEITLPIASNIGAAEDVAGVAFCGNIAAQGAEIIGVAANDTAKIQWKAADVTSQTWSFTFTYAII